MQDADYATQRYPSVPIVDHTELGPTWSLTRLKSLWRDNVTPKCEKVFHFGEIAKFCPINLCVINLL
jgi:hypothetical protein